MTDALEAKLRAAVKAGVRDAQGGYRYGQNSGNGQEWRRAVDPGGRGTRVAEGAEHEQSRAGAAEERAAGEAAGQDTGAAQVSTKALGVPEGTDRATARVIPAEEQTPAQRAKVAEYAKAGAELVLIEGNLEIQGETGTMHARGARIGDRIIASVNDEGATWEQIARHEAKHRYFEQHPDAVQQEWERVTGYMDADSVEEWLAYYAGKYAALGDIVDIAYIQEEALCDLAAEIETGKATERDYRALETVKAREKSLAERRQTHYTGSTNDQARFSVSEEELPDIIRKGAGIRWNGGRAIKLGKSEYAAVTSHISTRYYYTNTRHEGVQFIDRTTDGKNAQHYVYVYLDYGFGSYQIIGRMTYGLNDELIHTLREEITNDRTAEGISRSNERVRAIHEHPARGRETHKGRKGYQGDVRADHRSGGRREGSDRRAGWTDSVRHDDGGSTRGDGRGTGRGVKPKFSLSSAETKGDNRYDYKKSFAEQLEDWKAGKIPKADTLVVGPTPEVFRKIGFNALPVTINQRHVDYAINGTKNAEHQIGEAMLRQLPQAMQHPVAIIASETQNDTSVVALLPFTHQGNTVVLPVVVDGFGFQNSLKIDSNAATSVYGRGNAVTKLLTNAINGHNNGETTLFYLDKIKATALYRDTRVTMPKGTESNDGFYHSIRDAGSNVKPKFADVTESRQFKRWFGDWQKKPRSASKVVNADGTPKVVYHGTGSEFWTFDLKKSGTRFGEAAEGLFFFTNKKNGYQDSAADYAATAGGTPRIVEAYLDIKKPLRIDSKGAYTPTAYFDTHAEEIYIRYLEGDYDGIIVENSDKASDDSVIYMVDDSSQIKSATDNIGTFDRDEEDIRYSVDDDDANAQKNNARTGRGNTSTNGRYWRPNLNKTEWELLHRHVEREIGDRAHTLDEATKWLYASEKGAQVFALYGIGDGTEATPLYAVGGKTAERRYKELQACMEEIKNGTDRDATTVNQWLDRVQSAKRNHRAHLPATGGRTAANRNDSVHGGPSERDRGGAFATGEEDGRSEGGTVYSVENEADAAAATETDRARKLEDLARELEDERKRSKALEAVNRRLREQMKATPPGTADPASLRRAAKQLSEEYGGALRQKDIAADLQKIWRLRSEGKRGQMMEQVDKLAAELVQHYLDKDNPEAETLREIKQTVRATKIYLTPELRSDLDRDGGYQDFRRRNFGRIRLANSGLGVDQFYQELSEQWPAYFPAGIWNPADQLLQIADVIQDGTTVLQRSPMEAFPDGMTYMRNKVLWELGLVQPAKPTAADKVIRQAADAANRDALIDAAAAHEQEQMDKLDAWYREKLQKVKADREDRIQKVKDRYQERAQADRDWKAEQELKRRLLWHGNRLKRMGRTATPEQQAEIKRIFGDINLACQRMTGEVVIKDYIQGMSTEEIRPEGYRDKADPRRTMSVEEGFWHPEVRGDKVVDVERLKAWYEDQKKTNPDFIADRRVEDILANWEKKQINTMSVREVQQLLDVALNIENEIRTQKKLIDAEDRREVYQQVLEVIGDIESTRGRGDRNLPKVIGAVKDGGRWLVDGTLTPVRLLRRFTGYQDSDPLYRAALALQQGELKQLDYQRRAYARFESFTKDRKFMDYLAGKGKQKPIEITGMNERGEQVTCRITPDMRVALYLHSKNYQNLRHIQRGGIEIPDYAAYVAGRYTDAYDKATRIRLAPGTVRAIGETMTTREKNYAEEIRNYYNTMSKAEINAVSVKLKGYEVAKVGEYYPIATNRDFVVKEFDAIKYDGSLESFGFLKERKEGGTPILLADATRTLERSIQSHAAYIGMAIPMRNFNKLRGVSILDSTEAGEVRYQKQSLMDTLRKQWGTNAVKRLETMVADLSGTKPRESGMGMLNRIRSNYAGAVLELNPSTGMKQLIAYPSAASVLGWDAMAVGLTKWQKVDVKLIGRYTPLLWHRMQGFIDADLGDFAKNHGHRPRLLNWNQAGDLAVVKQIWKAAEWKVAHDDRTLLHDVEKWHKATAALFNRVVLESQANYTTMERGELLRTNNVFWRSITMFKTEPFQAFNVLYDGFANVAAKRRQLAAAQQLENEKGGREKVQAAEEAYRAAKKRVAQAVPAVIASNLLEAAITFAWALFRGKDKDWRDEESGEITAASFFKKLFIQAGSNIAGIVPLGGQLSEAAQAAIFGDRYYGMETTEVSIIDDTINSLLHIRGSIANMIAAGKTEEEAERARKVRAALDDFFKTLWDESMRLSVSIGVPVGNGEKILKGIFRWAFIAAMGKSEGEYWFRYCTEKSTASGRGSADADALFRAALDGDEESMDRMYAAMAKTKSEDSIQAAIRKRTKDAVDRGDVDLETAVGILQRLQTDKAADDLYWDVRGWQYMAQTGAESFGKYNILKDAIFSGGDAAAALQELEEHGIERDAAITQMHSQIGAWYTGTSDDGKTIQKTEALQLLQKYGDENEREAEETVREWTCKKETGYAYGDLSTAMVDGEITKEQAVDWLQKYGGKEKEVAQSTVKKWTCEKETGYAYGELREALQDGEVTEKNVAKWLQQYGGKDEEDATQQAAAWVFAGKHPELADKYGDEALESIANSYAKYGAGIPAAQFAKYKQDLDKIEGDPDGEGGYKRNTRKPKVYAYIAQLPLTPEQKDSLVHVASGSYNLKGTPW